MLISCREVGGSKGTGYGPLSAAHVKSDGGVPSSSGGGKNSYSGSTWKGDNRTSRLECVR